MHHTAGTVQMCNGSGSVVSRVRTCTVMACMGSCTIGIWDAVGNARRGEAKEELGDHV